MGKEKGCVETKKIRQQLWEYMCILVLTLSVETQFPLRRD